MSVIQVENIIYMTDNTYFVPLKEDIKYSFFIFFCMYFVKFDNDRDVVQLDTNRGKNDFIRNK